MELHLEGEHASRAYAMLASLVTPRPIVWVTTLGPDGVVNLAPFSFFNVLGASPPIVGFCPGDRGDGTPQDTARNIRLTHDFVVNLVDEGVAEVMNRIAASLSYGVNELTSAGLTTKPSSVVRPPRIAEAPASLECGEWGHASDWRQPAGHRSRQARACPRRVVRSGDAADSDQGVSCGRPHGQSAMVLPHAGSL